MELEGIFVNIRNKTQYPVKLTISNGKIAAIEELESTSSTHYILPGFVDAHIHIESSMLTPSTFAPMAVVHGTVGTVSDPHEIANVLGMEGVDYMIKSASKVPLKFNFGAPSCVPATSFETAGAELTATDVETLMARDEIKYLSEMMNWPGVLHRDEVVMQKIAAAQKFNKPVDGHAPGLKGEDARNYISAGISTDHECFSEEEALDKLNAGMKVLIREGSAAKNYPALHTLIDKHWQQLMFCSDDKHPDDLVFGHINQLVARALKDGHDLYKVLYMACIHPVEHYNLEIGTLQIGDLADFIVVEDLSQMNVQQTFINGVCVAKNGKALFDAPEDPIVNNFHIEQLLPSDFEMPKTGNSVRCIEAIDGELITKELHVTPQVNDEKWEADVEQDLLKIAVINRYEEAPVAVSFVKNFGINKGAIASSVAHDSHNIVVVGTSDEMLAKAANLVIDKKGGLSYADENEAEVLPLPIAGIISNLPGTEVAERYTSLLKKCKAAGSTLHSPYMTMSFLALLVIPQLKLSDKGLFDGQTFEFVSPQLP